MKEAPKQASLELPNIYFDADLDSLSSESTDQVQSFALLLNGTNPGKIEVKGHFNGSEPAEDKEELFQARTTRVKEMLLDAGTAVELISQSMGDESTLDGSDQNYEQRVTITPSY